MRLKMRIMKVSLAFMSILMLTATTQAADVVYCDYIGVPKGCVARDGVVLRPAPGDKALARTVTMPRGSSTVPPYIAPYNENLPTAYPYDKAKGNVGGP
jgi:hypothetical protein